MGEEGDRRLVCQYNNETEDGFEYSVLHIEFRHPPRPPPLPEYRHLPCGFMKVGTSGGDRIFMGQISLRCIWCGARGSGEDEQGLADYYLDCEEQLRQMLFSHYANIKISEACADDVAFAISGIIESVNTTSSCRYNPASHPHTKTDFLYIDVRPVPALTQEYVTSAAGAPLTMNPNNNNVGDDVCSVCLNDMTETEDETLLLITMPCAHTFHRDCLHRWLNTSPSCPICRYSLPTF